MSARSAGRRQAAVAAALDDAARRGSDGICLSLNWQEPAAQIRALLNRDRIASLILKVVPNGGALPPDLQDNPRIGLYWAPGEWWLPRFPIAFRVLLGVAIVALGIAGDLFESMLKRSAGVKDSSALIPGHGGVLDRIDALLFAAPIYYLVLKYV